MPTYQYVCTDCGEPLEVVQKFSDDALTECPACAGRLRKVFSAAGIIFKGSGFYRTDSRNGSSAAKTSANGSKPESKTDSKSESKSDSSSDSKAGTTPSKSDSGSSTGSSTTGSKVA